MALPGKVLQSDCIAEADQSTRVWTHLHLLVVRYFTRNQSSAVLNTDSHVRHWQSYNAVRLGLQHGHHMN